MSPLFVINTQSSRIQKKGSRLEGIAQSVKARVIRSDDIGVFKTAFRKAISEGAAHIFIEGGDGSVQTVLTEYFNWLPKDTPPAKFTIIGGGTTNQVAKIIGVKKPTPNYLESLIKGQHKTVHALPLLHISVDAQSPIYGFLFTSGAIPMATDYYMEEVRGSGKTGPSAVYTTILAALGKGVDKDNAFISETPVSLLVSTGKEETIIDENHLGTITTTLPNFILGIDPFWGKGDAPLRMTYVSGANKNLLGLVMNAALKRFGKLDEMDGVESWHADYIRYNYEGPIILDGEQISKSHKQIEIRASQTVTFLS